MDDHRGTLRGVSTETLVKMEPNGAWRPSPPEAATEGCHGPSRSSIGSVMPPRSTRRHGRLDVSRSATSTTLLSIRSTGAVGMRSGADHDTVCAENRVGHRPHRTCPPTENAPTWRAEIMHAPLSDKGTRERSTETHAIVRDEPMLRARRGHAPPRRFHGHQQALGASFRQEPGGRRRNSSGPPGDHRDDVGL